MLINLRNALMTGKRLPYDAEVEYLQSTGTQYILLPANNYDGIDIMLEPAESSTYGNIGRRSGTRADSICFNTTSGWGFRAYSASTWTNDTNRSLRHATVHGTTATLDGVSYTLANGWNTVAFTRGLFALFGLVNPSTQAMYAHASCKIGACALYVGSEKVYDFIPVRKGTVGYLYDRVSGKLFGNAGTGDFVLGPDVVPVEYIESHGTEYINSGFNITNAQSFAYDVKFSIAQSVTNAQPRLLSNEGAGAGNYYDIYIVNGALRARQANVAVNNAQRDTPIVAKMTEQGRYYSYYDSTPDALLWDATRTFTSPTVNMNYRIFSRGNDAQTLYRWQGKAWYMRFWKDGVPTRFFRPVRVGSGSTWEGAMMDVLTRRIYRNAGTGAFTYGNDLKYPIPSE